jgi:hypothetical protein
MLIGAGQVFSLPHLQSCVAFVALKAVSHVLFFFATEMHFFRHSQFSTLFDSMKEAESGKIVLVSCIIDFKDKPV